MSIDYSQPIRFTGPAGFRSIVIPGPPMVTHDLDQLGHLYAHTDVNTDSASGGFHTMTLILDPISRTEFEALWLTCRDPVSAL